MYIKIKNYENDQELNNFLISVCADAALRRNLLRIGVVIEPRSSITIHAPFSVS